MSIQGCVVALFGALSDADEAVVSLDAAGVPCRQVSMIARDRDELADPAVIGGLRERPIPSERVAAYEVLVGVGDVLVVVDGSDQTVRRAAWVLAHSSALAVDAFGRGSGRSTA